VPVEVDVVLICSGKPSAHVVGSELQLIRFPLVFGHSPTSSMKKEAVAVQVSSHLY
jgi:hypothetical protein